MIKALHVVLNLNVKKKILLEMYGHRHLYDNLKIAEV